MQTFLPFPDFAQSAKALDRQRLGKQRVEAKQILTALTGVPSPTPDPFAVSPKGWVNHPAVRMWRGHKDALALYGMMMCAEWLDRGYVDNLYDYFSGRLGTMTPLMPPWLGNPDFHRSHQSNLIRKLPAHYGPLFPGVPDNLPYVWPK